MDAKVTLSFDEAIINQAKEFADKHNISLSRLTEFLLRKATTKHYKSLENMPISNWVSIVAEGKVEYKTNKKTRSNLKSEYFNSKK